MITMPRIRRPSHRLTWRPGVNQRTTRGFIRIGATGAPSLAQHFLNSISADFVTSIGPYPGRWKRAYNPLRFREPKFGSSSTQPVRRQQRRSSADGDQGGGRYARDGSPTERAGAVLGLSRWGIQALRRRAPGPDDPRPSLRDRGLRGHPRLLEPRA